MYAFRLLKTKKCLCGREFDMLPRDYENSKFDYLPVVYWKCECGAQLLTDVENIDTSAAACDCHDCVESENPCFEVGGCLKNGELCPGCQSEARNWGDGEFDADHAHGRH